jgi:hypothetical protein
MRLYRKRGKKIREYSQKAFFYAEEDRHSAFFVM